MAPDVSRSRKDSFTPTATMPVLRIAVVQSLRPAEREGTRVGGRGRGELRKARPRRMETGMPERGRERVEEIADAERKPAVDVEMAAARPGTWEEDRKVLLCVVLLCVWGDEEDEDEEEEEGGHGTRTEKVVLRIGSRRREEVARDRANIVVRSV
jgi:hypothetical protein